MVAISDRNTEMKKTNIIFIKDGSDGRLVRKYITGSNNVMPVKDSRNALIFSTLKAKSIPKAQPMIVPVIPIIEPHNMNIFTIED